MTIKKPIFIIGAGRSGSSIFYQVFSHHPEVIWLSRLLNKYHSRISTYNWVMGMMDTPIIGPFLRKKLDARECYPFWSTIFNGFGSPYRDLRSDDVTDKIKVDFVNALASLKHSGKERHLIKLTGWSRIGFLLEIFPDAKFIHIVRDGRAVSNSLLNINFWRGYQGPGQWRWGDLSESDKALWDNTHQSFVALAGIQWNLIMDSVEHSSQILNNKNFKVVRYEDFCDEPIDTMKQVVQFAELSWDNKFEKVVNGYVLRSNNFKWKSDLTPEQQDIMAQVMKKYLEKYHYL